MVRSKKTNNNPSIYDNKTNKELEELPCMDWSNMTGNLDNGSVPINPLFAKRLYRQGLVKPHSQKRHDKE